MQIATTRTLSVTYNFAKQEAAVVVVQGGNACWVIGMTRDGIAIGDSTVATSSLQHALPMNWKPDDCQRTTQIAPAHGRGPHNFVSIANPMDGKVYTLLVPSHGCPETVVVDDTMYDAMTRYATPTELYALAGVA